jgi:1-Cys peroxiredoxin 6
MDGIVRCVEALQLSYQKSIATPANWPNNSKSLPLGDGTHTSAYRGSVFLLPTVSDEDANEYFPGHLTCAVPSGIPYLRLVKAKDIGIVPSKLSSHVETAPIKVHTLKETAPRKKKGGMIARWFRN